jgi:hypothetical protein
MMRNLACLAVLCSLAAAASTARAGTRVSKAGSIAIDIPDAWKVGGNDTLIAVEDPTQQMGMLVIVVDKADARKALAGVDKLLARNATNIKWAKKAKAVELGGMKGLSRDGSATMHGKQVVTTVVIVGPTATGKGVIEFAGAEPGWLQAHGAELLASFRSLRAAT